MSKVLSCRVPDNIHERLQHIDVAVNDILNDAIKQYLERNYNTAYDILKKENTIDPESTKIHTYRSIERATDQNQIHDCIIKEIDKL